MVLLAGGESRPAAFGLLNLTIERSSRAASFIDLPLTSPGQFKASPVDWGPSS